MFGERRAYVYVLLSRGLACVMGCDDGGKGPARVQIFFLCGCVAAQCLFEGEILCTGCTGIQALLCKCCLFYCGNASAHSLSSTDRRNLEYTARGSEVCGAAQCFRVWVSVCVRAAQGCFCLSCLYLFKANCHELPSWNKISIENETFLADHMLVMSTYYGLSVTSLSHMLPSSMLRATTLSVTVGCLHS